MWQFTNFIWNLEELFQNTTFHFECKYVHCSFKWKIAWKISRHTRKQRENRNLLFDLVVVLLDSLLPYWIAESEAPPIVPHLWRWHPALVLHNKFSNQQANTDYAKACEKATTRASCVAIFFCTNEKTKIERGLFDNRQEKRKKTISKTLNCLWTLDMKCDMPGKLKRKSDWSLQINREWLRRKSISFPNELHITDMVLFSKIKKNSNTILCLCCGHQFECKRMRIPNN